MSTTRKPERADSLIGNAAVRTFGRPMRLKPSATRPCSLSVKSRSTAPACSTGASTNVHEPNFFSVFSFLFFHVPIPDCSHRALF